MYLYRFAHYVYKTAHWISSNNGFLTVHVLVHLSIYELIYSLILCLVYEMTLVDSSCKLLKHWREKSYEMHLLH